MKICEKCGAYYDAWDGRCDCEEVKADKLFNGGGSASEKAKPKTEVFENERIKL